MSSSSTLNKQIIISALQQISDLLGKDGVDGEICICGGTALLLAFDARDTTKDIDSMYAPTDQVRRAASKVGEKLELSEDWLNDAAKGYLGDGMTPTTENMPQFDHLKVTRPDTEYLFYMKCMASRIGGGSSDVPDIKFLGHHLNVTSSSQALKILEKFRSGRDLPMKIGYLLEELFD